MMYFFSVALDMTPTLSMLKGYKEDQMCECGHEKDYL